MRQDNFQQLILDKNSGENAEGITTRSDAVEQYSTSGK